MQHKSWTQRGGYGAYRMPQDHFQLHFGAEHRFHMSTREVRIGGEYPQFLVDGYWVTLLDPVPEYWGEDWYEIDDVDVVETTDGYYLTDTSHPEDLVAIRISEN